MSNLINDMNKKIIFFDLGGTLIDDPFPETIKLLQKYCIETSILPFPFSDQKKFFNYWIAANREIDFSFASHFLQEEIWPAKAFLKLQSTCNTPPKKDIPLLSVSILKLYRELAIQQIKNQPQMNLLRRLLQQLKKSDIELGVASNDREFATSALLSYAGMIEYFDYIFTSEGLSEKKSGAEKPSTKFFQAIFHKISSSIDQFDVALYVGDSERNDILPAQSIGFQTLRYINKRNISALWIDETEKTVADFKAENHKDFFPILSELLNISLFVE